MLAGVLAASAQDVIVRNDGSTVLCRIVEVNGTDVVYLKWSDLNGPRYIIDRSAVANINYQDGRQERINQQSANAYAPGNQQTGDWSYNDNALVALDRSMHVYDKKIRTLKTVGWTVGPALLVGGGVLFGYCIEFPVLATLGSVLMAGGIATTTVCLIKANRLKKLANEISCAPVFEHEFELANGSRLCAGIDMIRDNRFRQSTLGIGLKYNF